MSTKLRLQIHGGMYIDGYHKLIRWRIVVHGEIDGYSRVVGYLKAAVNNKASIALSAFKIGVQEYGLPSEYGRT